MGLTIALDGLLLFLKELEVQEAPEVEDEKRGYRGGDNQQYQNSLFIHR